jgi:hypothetical protein
VNVTIGRAVTALAAVAVVAVASVVVADRWRASGVHPPGCGSVILSDARGTQTGDTGLQTDAWSAVTDPGGRATGRLDGPRPVLDRSCLLYAGPTDAADDPSVVFVESTPSGRSELLRILEVRPRSGTLAGTGYQAVIGSETAAGVVLPLSGTYLAPPDVESVAVLGSPAQPAPAVAPGVFRIGAKPAALLLRRGDAGAPVLVVVPAVPVEGYPPLRVPLELTVNGKGTADQATLTAVEQVLPLFLADPRTPLLAQGAPTLAVRTAPYAGGQGVVLQSADPALPQFKYFVPAVGPAAVVP